MSREWDYTFRIITAYTIVANLHHFPKSNSTLTVTQNTFIDT